MTDQKRALTALHDEGVKTLVDLMLRRANYQFTSCVNMDELLINLGFNITVANGIALPIPFDYITMDVNLGIYGGETIEPAQRIFRMLKPQIDAGKLIFVAATGKDYLSEAACREGIPCIAKPDNPFWYADPAKFHALYDPIKRAA